jgi:hypothetical protein
MMSVAIYHMLNDFVDVMKKTGKIHSWYTSLKNDGRVPSVRIYMKVQDDDVAGVMKELNVFLQQRKHDIGWTGEFFQPDEIVNITDERLSAINKACELVLGTYKQFPLGDRLTQPEFRNEIMKEIGAEINSINPKHQTEFRHFIANNLAMNDDQFTKFCMEQERSNKSL